VFAITSPSKAPTTVQHGNPSSGRRAPSSPTTILRSFPVRMCSPRRTSAITLKRAKSHTSQLKIFLESLCLRTHSHSYPQISSTDECSDPATIPLYLARRLQQSFFGVCDFHFFAPSFLCFSISDLPPRPRFLKPPLPPLAPSLSSLSFFRPLFKLLPFFPPPPSR